MAVFNIEDTGDSHCSISGLAVQINPNRMMDVKEQLHKLPGVEVHITDPTGKMVVTVEEEPGERTMVDTMTRISQVDGVISTALVYTHQE
ncbi:chaperone NapD [Endozoicomonas arenosclerae]|uniref:chaperone NapD n=1 Tax=Endozoicomonas arenosclerae TaxID=1633495 RepID=UPI000780817A|nr:chaperone NapD [Endozoicomonas arenosclerae]